MHLEQSPSNKESPVWQYFLTMEGFHFPIFGSDPQNDLFSID